VLVFMLAYLAVYGGVNAYLWLKVRQALRPAGPWNLVLVLFVVVMVLGPLIAARLDRGGVTWAARPAALAAYVWMAWSFWFLVLGLLGDGWNLLARVAARGWAGAAGLVITPRGGLIMIAVLILLATAWGLREAADLRLERVTVRTPRLAPGSPPIRIAQISDLHLDLLVNETRLGQVIGLIEEGRPDLVVSTGDILDGSAVRQGVLAGLLAAVNPPLGKIAVTGNHEFYAGPALSFGFLESAGFRVLRDERVDLPGGLVVSGVDDPAFRRRGDDGGAAEEQALPPDGAAGFRLLLKHRPAARSESLGRFDLQLSGHTHRGQIFPFGFITRLQYPFLAGLFDLGNGSSLRVSRGTGTWGPPLRVLAPPEVTLLVLEPAG
jgi:predicted MPP superfamily phosphohydrolase